MAKPINLFLDEPSMSLAPNLVEFQDGRFL